MKDVEEGGGVGESRVEWVVVVVVRKGRMGREEGKGGGSGWKKGKESLS